MMDVLIIYLGHAVSVLPPEGNGKKKVSLPTTGKGWWLKVSQAGSMWMSSPSNSGNQMLRWASLIGNTPCVLLDMNCRKVMLS